MLPQNFQAIAEYRAIEVRERHLNAPERWCLPQLYLVDPLNPTVLSPNGQSYNLVALENQRVLENWRLKDPYSPKEQDALDQLFVKKYQANLYPKMSLQPFEKICGWIDRDGNLYPCRYGEHGDAAYNLSIVHFDQLGGSNTLCRAGWIRLDLTGGWNIPDFELLLKPSGDQLETLNSIAQYSSDKDFARIIQLYLTIYKRSERA